MEEKLFEISLIQDAVCEDTAAGVTMWIPPGPGGVVATAAGLSYIAAKMVGW